MIVYIYSLTFSDGKQYIGRSKDPHGRLGCHYYSRRTRAMAQKLIDAWEKLGTPKMDVICSCFSIGDAIEVESQIICDRNTVYGGYNTTHGDSVLKYPNPIHLREMAAEQAERSVWESAAREDYERRAKEKAWRLTLSEEDREAFDSYKNAHSQARRFAERAGRKWTPIDLVQRAAATIQLP